MIKKLLLLLVFIPVVGFSQSYSVTYSFTEHLHNDSGGEDHGGVGDDGGEEEENPADQGGLTYQVQIGNDINFKNIVTWGPGVTIYGGQGSFSISSRPIQLRVRSITPAGVNIGDVVPITYVPADGHCFEGVIQIDDPNGLTINLFLQIEPNLTINLDFDSKSDQNTYPNTCETLTISAPSNYTENLYNWEYSIGGVGGGIGGGSWEELPEEYQRTHTFEIAMIDIPSLVVNQPIQFRIRYCSNRTSGIVNTHFIICSPSYTDFEAQQPMCFYNQGGFTIIFSRALDEGEEIGFYLNKDFPSGTDAIPIEIPSIDSLPENNTYTFDGLEIGDYFLTYQSLPDGSISDPIDFKIEERTPVSFTASGTNIHCFNTNDGSIQLTAQGGVGGYQYQLHDGSDWVTFDEEFSHTITGLPPADYQIKVRDANECTAKIIEE